MPPSTNTGTRPAAAATTAGNSSTLGGSVSSVRPPWFETTSPAAPLPIARSASRGSVTPFTSTGSFVRAHSHSRSAQVGAVASRPPQSPCACPAGLARPPPRFAATTPGGRRKPARCSVLRTPLTGASTVTTSAS